MKMYSYKASYCRTSHTSAWGLLLYIYIYIYWLINDIYIDWLMIDILIDWLYLRKSKDIILHNSKMVDYNCWRSNGYIVSDCLLVIVKPIHQVVANDVIVGPWKEYDKSCSSKRTRLLFITY